MYQEILEIIFYYSANYKLPDKAFIEKIISLVVSYEKLDKYITSINYNYDGSASYGYISKILKFNISTIIDEINKDYNFYSGIYNLNENSCLFNKYLFICFKAVIFILHELEHCKQIKRSETASTDDFEKNIIDNNLNILSINPELYKKEHNLFLIERMASIRSYREVNEILKLDTSLPIFISDIFNKNYICLLVYNYSKQSYPLLEYVNTTRSLILYDDIFVNQKNTSKILKKSKKVLSIDDRLLYGLPISNIELNRIHSKIFD